MWKRKFCDDLVPARRVRDFGMKLQAVELSLDIFDRGKVGIFRVRDACEIPSGSAVSLSPWLFQMSMLRADARRKAECAGRCCRSAGAIFAPGAELDFAAEMARHQLHPVADSQEPECLTRRSGDRFAARASS